MNKNSLLVLTFVCSFFFTSNAQFSDNFDDGDFTTNPAWVGDTGEWIIDSANELRSNNFIANSTYYLSTASTLATEAQWDLNIQLLFNTSSLNYVDIFLTASDSALRNPATSGYFVRLGGIDDEIALYRKSSTGTITKIIDGVNGVLNTSSNKIKLRVTRNAANQWSLLRDITFTGANYFLEGTVNDATYTTSAYFGILVKQSTTTSFAGRHYFDDIQVSNYIPDLTPPTLQSVTLLTGTTIDVLFNEPVDPTTAEVAVNYNVDNGVGSPVSAVRDATNPALVHLTFGAAFPNSIVNTITISNVTDISGNAMGPTTATFTYTPDLTPPSIQSVAAASANIVDVLFSEPVNATSTTQLSNYSVDNGIGNPTLATIDPLNPALVHLTFGTNFTNGFTHTITVNNVADPAGNILLNGTATFSYYIAQLYDVVIDEIMADPDPVQRLPNAEYIELKNVSGKTLSLEGWKFSSLSTTSGAFRSVILPPDSFLIITSSTNVGLFSPYGRTISVSPFPALLNDGTTLTLTSKEGVIIHSVAYSSSWYQNPVKSQGGWSLEMIDPKNPCTGMNNWKASADSSGGTPGRKNSIDANNPDATAPSLVRAAVVDSVTLLLSFTEILDVAKASTISNYTITGGTTAIVSATPVATDATKVSLSLSNPIQSGITYTVTVSNVSDCSGNIITGTNSAMIGLPQSLDSFDIVINEILFDPKPNEFDYVEIYNRSNKIVDLKNLFIANRSSSTNQISTLKQVSTETILMFPGDYFVITENPDVVKQRYYAANPNNFITVSGLPTYANDQGDVVLMNNVGRIVDELAYNVKWHFALLDNEEGVALERIDYDKPTQDPLNWHSAASTVGFGTPTYKNSQYKADAGMSGEITATPKTFSPDNDGFEDYTTLNYQLTENGYVANITIFDAVGRPVRVLSRNATLGLKGSFRWDGLDDKQKRLPVGAYVIYTEIFNLNGKKKGFKTPVVLATRF